jgi:hypothetical protein
MISPLPLQKFFPRVPTPTEAIQFNGDCSPELMVLLGVSFNGWGIDEVVGLYVMIKTHPSGIGKTQVAFKDDWFIKDARTNEFYVMTDSEFQRLLYPSPINPESFCQFIAQSTHTILSPHLSPPPLSYYQPPANEESNP